MCNDTSLMKAPNARKKYWVLVKDQATCMKRSYFVKNKDNQVQHIIDIIKEINQMNNRKVQFIRCDNAEENKTLETECKKEGLGIKLEYTTRNTPQHNRQAERSFATLYGKIQAMLQAAGMKQSKKERYWI